MLMAEKHYAPDELAELWGVSTETIRSIFRDEPGVLKIGSTGSRGTDAATSRYASHKRLPSASIEGCQPNAHHLAAS
jgi:hypothetical protein